MQPFYLPSGNGRRFCIYHCIPGCEVRGAIIYIHPFAEEMNKSRRMAAMQARRLAESGYGVLQIDLLGCGDSSGDFGDAGWSAWIGDVLLAYRWLRQQTAAPLTLWGLRAGCLLAAAAALDLPESPNFIFWQPVLSGKQHWQQFMRLKMAGELASGQAKGGAEQLRMQMAAGQSVEIAGYIVSPALADGLERAELFAPSASGQVTWLEVSSREEATLSPASQKCSEQWRSAGFTVESKVVRGPAFWQSTEIEDAPDLMAETLLALDFVP